MEEANFGADASKYTLCNGNGMSVTLTNFGATCISVKVPDKNNNISEITLGYDTLEEYKKDTCYFGATVGRVANRICKGRFTLEGKDYQLATNNGPNHLHGGNVGFSKVMWQATPFKEKGEQGVRFHYNSKDGEEGYPGNVKVTATYKLTEANELIIEFEAETDKLTPINLTNHNYWNLDGADSGTILEHELQLNAERYLPVDSTLIPTGELKEVKGTEMDFTTSHSIGSFISKVEGGGYDHCYQLHDQSHNKLSKAARVVGKKSGRIMEIWTTQPGIQLYTGNFLDNVKGANGVTFGKHHAFCLETQGFPDAVNKPNFPSVLLAPGQKYHHVTVHKFFAE